MFEYSQSEIGEVDLSQEIESFEMNILPKNIISKQRYPGKKPNCYLILDIDSQELSDEFANLQRDELLKAVKCLECGNENLDYDGFPKKTVIFYD